MENIYLDYNSHTPCDPSVIKKMNEVWTESGNPHSSSHSFGWKKQRRVDDALALFAGIYDCFEDELLFTSGATEANNLAVFSGIELAKNERNKNSPVKRNTILTSHLEHKSVLQPLQVIADKLGLNLVYVRIMPLGQIDLEDLQSKFKQGNVLWLSCAMTNGIVGMNQPIKQISELCQQYEVMLHVDASQAGYLDISCHDLEVDFLTLSAHKIYGPSGVGLLYSKHLNNSNFGPMIVGGGQQEGLRAGTLPVPLIVGFAEASRIIDENNEEEALKLTSLRQILFDGLTRELPIRLIGDLNNRHPGNLYLAIEGVDSMTILNNIQPQIAFSLGSACDGLNREYSPLLKEMGISKELSECAFRICVGRMSTEEEVRMAIDKIVFEANKILHK